MIVICSIIGLSLVVLVILACTLTPERSESLGAVFAAVSRLVQGVRGKSESKSAVGPSALPTVDESKRQRDDGFRDGAIAVLTKLINDPTVKDVRAKMSAGNTKTGNPEQ